MSEVEKMSDSGFPSPLPKPQPVQIGHAKREDTLGSIEHAFEKALQDNACLIRKKTSLQTEVK